MCGDSTVDEYGFDAPPSNWHIAFGEPLPTAAYGASAADGPMITFNLIDQVRGTIQQNVYQLFNSPSQHISRSMMRHPSSTACRLPGHHHARRCDRAPVACP
jgi:hypothetical protein